MDGKLGTFLLGVIATVALVILWKDNDNGSAFSFPGLPAPIPSVPTPSLAGCNSCGASPIVQANLEGLGTAGFIAPPGVPLGTPVSGGASTSLFTSAGSTPDTSFTFGKTQNVSGSPTTQAASTPVRATQSVAPYSTGFHQHYNILGVPIKGYLN